MPILKSSADQRVLVTGANGFIALWVVRTLLEQGYAVRGTVRSEGRGTSMKELFSSYGDKFEWVVVEDITKEGAFDEAVKGVDAIEHMASPLNPAGGDPDDYIKPAVHGTLGILESALKLGTQVKRIVITSSVAAVRRLVIQTPGLVFDESDWGDESVQAVKEQGSETPNMVKYSASKTLAELAAWDFYKKHKAEIGWDLVVINPPFVFGRPLHDVKSPTELGSSLALWYTHIVEEKPDDQLGTTYGYIEVRDVAAAHVESLKKEKAGGERIIVSQGTTTWQDTRNLLHTLRPELYAETGSSSAPALPRGNPDLKTQTLYGYNAEKGKRILGLKYRTIEEITLDIVADYEARGWVGK